MSNTELIRKKSISLTEATHARLMEVVGFLQTKRGTNTTANQAINELIDLYDQVKGQFETNNPGLLEQNSRENGNG